MWMYALTTLGSYQKSSHLSLFLLILGFFGLFFGLFACYFAAPAMRQGEDVKALLLPYGRSSGNKMADRQPF